MHGDLAVVFMIFGLITFPKVKLQPPPLIIRNAIHQTMTHLIFVHEVGNMWMWGADQFVLWVFRNEKPIWHHLIFHVTTLGHEIVNVDFKLGVHWHMTHVESNNNVIHLHIMEW